MRKAVKILPRRRQFVAAKLIDRLIPIKERYFNKIVQFLDGNMTFNCGPRSLEMPDINVPSSKVNRKATKAISRCIQMAHFSFKIRSRCAIDHEINVRDELACSFQKKISEHAANNGDLAEVAHLPREFDYFATSVRAGSEKIANPLSKSPSIDCVLRMRRHQIPSTPDVDR